MKIKTLEELDEYEVPSFLAERIALIYHVPEDFAEGIIREAKRMLFLFVQTKKYVVPSDRVDWAWHEMILFTEFYRDFCSDLGGFIHHVPNPPRSGDDEKESWEDIQRTLGKRYLGTEAYEETKKIYKTHFDITPNPLYWP